MNAETKKTQTIPSSPRFISAYSPKLKIQITFPAQGREKQSFKDECDINTIMKRYQSTGVLPDLLIKQGGQFLDVTGIDYESAMQQVAQAQSLFEELPSAVRARFENNPAKFLDFTSVESNREELAEMGLLDPAAVARMAQAKADLEAQNQKTVDTTVKTS